MHLQKDEMSNTETRRNRQPDIELIDESFDKEATQTYHLSLQLGLNGFFTCILDTARNKYICLFGTSFRNVNDFRSLSKFIDKLFSENAFLQYKYKSISASIVHNKSTLVPIPLYEKPSEAGYLEYNHVIEENESIYADRLGSINAMNIYTLHNDLEQIIRKALPKVNIFHHSSSLIEGLLAHYKNHIGKKLIVHFQPNHFEIIVLDGKNLVLYNSFEHQAKEDFVYYIMFVCEQLKLNPETLRLILTGEIDKTSGHYSLLYQFVKNIGFGERNDTYDYSYVFNEIPKHFYYNLFSQYSLV